MPTPPREHPLTQRPRKSNRCPKVDLNHPIELLKGVVGELPNPRHPGIGDKDVDVAAEVNDPLNLMPLRKVSDDGPPPNLLREIVKQVGPPPGQGELTPLTPQPPSDSLPKPTRSPGNKNRPPTKFHVRMVIRPHRGRRTLVHRPGGSPHE